MQTELNKVVTALSEFYAHETFLLEKDVGERALTHRLAVHLEHQFAGWQVDCDYDRLGERTLRLTHGTIVSTDDHLAKSIYPDIVVHQREIPNNLLTVEVRKSTNHQPLEHDQHKLQALTDPHLWFAYWIGVFVTLEEAGHDVGSLYRRGERSGFVEMVRRTAEGCGRERGLISVERAADDIDADRTGRRDEAGAGDKAIREIRRCAFSSTCHAANWTNCQQIAVKARFKCSRQLPSVKGNLHGVQDRGGAGKRDRQDGQDEFADGAGQGAGVGQ